MTSKPPPKPPVKSTVVAPTKRAVGRPDVVSSEEPTRLAGPELAEEVRRQLAQSQSEVTVVGIPDMVVQQRAGMRLQAGMAAAMDDGDAFAPRDDAYGFDHLPHTTAEDTAWENVAPPSGRAAAAPLPTAASRRTTAPIRSPVHTPAPVGPPVLSPAPVKPPMRTHRVGSAEGKLLVAVPLGADVLVSGQPAGSGSVLLLGLTPQDKVAVEVSHPGYSPWRSLVSLGGRTTGQVRVELKRLEVPQ